MLAKVAGEHLGEVKKAYWALFDDTGTEPGEGAIAVVRARAEHFVITYAKRFPAAVDCLMADFASLTTYLRFPLATTPASATPTSSNAPSARPAGESR